MNHRIISTALYIFSIYPLLTPVVSAQTPRLVKDIVAGSGDSIPRLFTVAGGLLYFVATTQGTFHVSNGTTSGTRRLGTVTGVTLLIAGSRRVYAFSNRDVWTSLGGKTVKLRTFARRFISSDRFRMATVGDTLFFAADDGKFGQELWKSDGTPAGTVLVKDINASGHSGPGSMVSSGARVFFSANEPKHGNELWTSDGTTLGTRLVKDIRTGTAPGFPQEISVFGRRVVFSADDGTHGREPWISDGLASGTRLVKDLITGTGSVRLQGFTQMSDRFYFNTTRGAIWGSDGTASGTALVKQIPNFRFGIANMTAAGNRLFFWHWVGAGGYHLWTSDGSGTGTTLVGVWSNLGPFSALGDGRVAFPAKDTGVLGQEVFVSDGTKAGTFAFEVRKGTASSGAREVARIGTRLFTSATDGTRGIELWAIDNMATSTPLLGGCSAARVYATPPRLGGKMHLDLRDFPAGKTSILGIGLPTSGISLGSCRLWVNPNSAILLPFVATAGGWQTSVSVPNNPNIIGIPIVLQGVHDAPNRSIAMSDAREVRAGR